MGVSVVPLFHVPLFVHSADAAGTPVMPLSVANRAARGSPLSRMPSILWRINRVIMPDRAWVGCISMSDTSVTTDAPSGIDISSRGGGIRR